MASSASNDRDMSNGWEEVVGEFASAREQASIGIDVVRAWALNLPSEAAILDIGCGTGVPVSLALMKDKFRIYGVDASPTMTAEFARRLPQMRVACEPVETSSFFDRSFDGVVAIGLMFLLPADVQRNLIIKVASVLNPGGHLLFTSPSQACEWTDRMTGRESRSLGSHTYIKLFSKEGLIFAGNYTDEGGNCHLHFQKPCQSVAVEI